MSAVEKMRSLSWRVLPLALLALAAADALLMLRLSLVRAPGPQGPVGPMGPKGEKGDVMLVGIKWGGEAVEAFPQEPGGKGSEEARG